MSAGPGNENGQSVEFIITGNTAPFLFSSQPFITPDGVLRFEAAPNAYGTSIISVRLRDTGGGDDQSSTKQFAISILGVPETPLPGNDERTVFKNSVSNVFDVLSNDSIAVAGVGPLRVMAVSPPVFGTAGVAINNSGVVYTPAPNFVGTDSFAYTLVDAEGGSATGIVTIHVRAKPETSIGVGGPLGAPTNARQIDASSDQTLLRADPFPGFLGGITATTGDVNGDGISDLIVVAGPGGHAHVKVFDGQTSSLILSFIAYAGFEGAVTLAAGDINNDGRADILVGTLSTSSHVRVYSGRDASEIASFIAYEGYQGGISVAAGDLNGDGFADIVVGTRTQNSHVKAYSGRDGGTIFSAITYTGYTGGISIAAGDLDGDGFAEVIVGALIQSSHVKAFRASDAAEVASFFAYDPGYLSGLDVIAVDADRNGVAEIGTYSNIGKHFKAFAFPGLAQVRSFLTIE